LSALKEAPEMVGRAVARRADFIVLKLLFAPPAQTR
jgi:hypothetical protein